MAQTATSQGARIAAATPSPIALHAQAMNSLNRCRWELLKPATSFEEARTHLEHARQALEALEIATAIAAH